MDAVRRAYLGRRSFRQSQITDLSFAHELGHSPDGLFDRRRRIYAVDVIKVDIVRAQTLETLPDRLADEFRASLACYQSPIGIAVRPEFGGENDLASPIADNATDQSFVMTISIDVGRIDKVNSGIEDSIQCLDRFPIFYWLIYRGKRHCAETD